MSDNSKYDYYVQRDGLWVKAHRIDEPNGRYIKVEADLGDPCTNASPRTHFYPVFVYGTLRKGEGNHRIIQPYIDSMLPAALSDANLYDLGAFPAVSDGDGYVIGELYGLKNYGRDNYAEGIQELDWLEGVGSGLYKRELRTVIDNRGGVWRAWVYLAGQTIRLAEKKRIASGDWLKR